ncbi:menaquinone biosynthesis protein, partial [Flavobacteriales bacterium]|nr:menaquinone biosynthesis protein [Flavobacteriales bacterium]
MLKISAVSYLNTVPFIHGLKQSVLIHSIGLQLDYPSICADKLINGIVDLALVPVAVIPKLLQAHIISDYCIGANGAVDTVCLYSDVPITEIESIALDYQSRTSVALLKILLKEYWQLNPELKKADVGFEENIKGKHAALVIGDRAFALNDKHAYIYDLSAIWKEMTGLPFVFAAWVANKKLPQDF